MQNYNALISHCQEHFFKRYVYCEVPEAFFYFPAAFVVIWLLDLWGNKGHYFVVVQIVAMAVPWFPAPVLPFASSHGGRGRKGATVLHWFFSLTASL